MRAHIEQVEISESFFIFGGWACRNDGSPLEGLVTISVDLAVPAPLYLQYREDLHRHGIGDGIASFWAVLPRLSERPGTVTISCSGEHDLKIDVAELPMKPFFPRGAIDTVGPEGVRGWLYDPERAHGGRNAIVTIADCDFIAELNMIRTDLPYSTPGTSEKLFGFNIPVEAIMPVIRKQAFHDVTKPMELYLRSGSLKLWRYVLMIAGGDSFGEAAALPADLAIPPLQPVHSADRPVSGRLASGQSIDVSQKAAVERHLPVHDVKPETSVTGLQVTVVSWDMAHNPLGRAYVLADIAAEFADVNLTGPLFQKFGMSLWGPLRGQTKIPIQTFAGGTLREYLKSVIEEVENSRKVDIIYVSKARLPSVMYGLLMKLRHGSTLVIDVDDYELSFFKDAQPLSLEEGITLAKSDPISAESPFEQLWTRITETLLPLADGFTVSNVALKEKFGGEIIRHARDETVFEISPEKRSKLRKEFGLSPQDIVILFIGTPRPHKGIFEVANALEQIDNPRLVFVLIGSINDRSVSNVLKKYKKARILHFDDQPFERLHEIASIGDLAPILQRAESAIADFQIPAKLTDAFALGIPVAATRVPPLEDIHAVGALITIDAANTLEKQLRRLVVDATVFDPVVAKATELYHREFTYAANARRLSKVFRDAKKSSSNSDLTGIFDTVSQIFDVAGVQLPHWASARPTRPAYARQRPRDLVFFWKQNDTELYGRRSDMMLKYLLASGRIGKVLHLDRPRKLSELTETIDRGQYARLHEGNLVFTNTIERMLKMRDTSRVARRTFIHRDGSVPQSLFGSDLPPADAYVDFVQSEMKTLGIESSPMAWVCPVVFDFPEVHKAIGFSPIIVDIIDDQRRWKANEHYMKMLERSYAETLGLGDLIMANCEPVRKGFADLSAEIRVVPNGAEEFGQDVQFLLPPDLAELPRPWIGYVGNLRDRVDTALIREMATRHPDWSIVLIGSARGALDIISLGELPNVYLLGVRPYERALAYIKHFDVAIMPHLANEISENMNPLKLYVYFALGKIIITTAVSNISEIEPFAVVAKDTNDFILSVQRALDGQIEGTDKKARSKLLRKVSWRSRVEQAMAFLDM